MRFSHGASLKEGFLGLLSSATTQRVLDVVFFHGSPALFAVALALLRGAAPALLACAEAPAAMAALKEHQRRCYDADRWRERGPV